MATLIPAIGKPETVYPEQGKKFKLSELQKLVSSGQSIDRSLIENMPVHPKRKEDGIAYLCNENGLELNLPVITFMSMYLGYTVLGDVLRITSKEWS